jgi:hypothetical protein
VTRRSIALLAVIAVLALVVGALAFSGRSPLTTSTRTAANGTDDEFTNERFAEEQREFEELTRARSGESASSEAVPVPEPDSEEGDLGPSQQILERAGTEQVFDPIRYIRNKKWVGETLFGTADDWEPDIAADPNSNYVYWTTTRYGVKNKACDDCPLPSLVYRVSPDNGDTWGPVQYLCACANGGWQADPQIEVADDGTVYALILQRWHTYLVKSTDHGQTFSDPVDVAPSMSWTDHGFLTISDDGQDVVVAFNHADSYVVLSHDGGATWGTPIRTSPDADHGTRYYYHYKGAITGASDEIMNIGASSVPIHSDSAGRVAYFDLHSTDGGTTWTQVPLGTYKHWPACVERRCRADHLGGMINIAKDDSGNLVAVYAGTNVSRDGQMIFTSTSTDGGATWNQTGSVSPRFSERHRRVIASFPQVIGTGNGDFRMWWQDDRVGVDDWNTWYTNSTDTGATWDPKDIRISDAVSGAEYKHPKGYFADYGDYGGIAMLSDGRTIATWGEAWSYWGPGGTWINRQP